MNLYKNAIIFGGTGLVGKYLLSHLRKKNIRCIVASRDPFSKAYTLKTQTQPGFLEFIKFDLDHLDEVKKAISNSHIVINLIGTLHANKKKFFRTHADIPEILSKLCKENNVEKFILCSALGADKNSKSFYKISKAEGEERALSNFENTVIIRPSVLEATESMLSNLYATIASFSPIIPVPKMNTYKIQPLMADDCAKAIVSAIKTKDNSKAIYELGGNKIYTFGEYVNLILKIIRKKRIVIDMPMSLAKLQSSIFSILPFKPLISRDQCIILEEKDNVVSGEHLSFQDLNIKPTDVEKEMERFLWRHRASGEFSKA